MDNLLNYKTNVEPQKGGLLISEPYLPDPNFERTVILLCEHNEEGSFGFVLNKPSKITFEEVIEEASGFKEKLYIGGPVQQDTLHFIHKSVNSLEGGIEIVPDLYWGGNFEELMIMINTKQIQKEDFRFFIGYSGWGKGQLDKEIEENSWIVCNPVDPAILFTEEPNELWKVILSQMGGKFEVFSKFPIDPRLN